MAQGHIGTVTSVAWSHDSIYLATAATDGAVLGWFMDGFWKYSECVTIGSLYSSIVYDRSRRFVYACGLNISLRALDTDKKIAIEQTLPEEINSDDEIPPVTDEEDENLSGSCWEHHIFRFDPAIIIMILRVLTCSLGTVIVKKSPNVCDFWEPRELEN